MAFLLQCYSQQATALSYRAQMCDVPNHVFVHARTLCPAFLCPRQFMPSVLQAASRLARTPHQRGVREDSQGLAHKSAEVTPAASESTVSRRGALLLPLGIPVWLLLEWSQSPTGSPDQSSTLMRSPPDVATYS